MKKAIMAFALCWLLAMASAPGVRAADAAAMLNVKDFGAVGDGATDDTAAVQKAINNIGGGPGILVFPRGTYRITKTLHSSGSGNFLLGSGTGLFTYPVLSWAGEEGGTLFVVRQGHHGFRMENFYLQGNKIADHLLHVQVKKRPAGSTHDPEFANLMFRGYRDYAMILGEDDEKQLADGQLSDVVCRHLRFWGNVEGSSGILINAQNMEIGSFYTLRFDPQVLHRHHIFNRAGIVQIYGLVSTRAADYAIMAWDTVSVHGWRSEDPLLYQAIPVGFSSPVVLSGILQRGNSGDNVIVWREQGSVPFAIHDAVLQGNVVVGPTVPSNSLFSNIQFRKGRIITQGPQAARYVDLSADEGRLTMQAPSPSLVLRDLKGRVRLRADENGLALGGMLKTARGADVASAAAVTLGAGGNLFRVTGSEAVGRIEPLPAGTMIVLYFEKALTVQDADNLKLAGAFAATPDSTLMLISDGKNWLELSRSQN